MLTCKGPGERYKSYLAQSARCAIKHLKGSPSISTKAWGARGRGGGGGGRGGGVEEMILARVLGGRGGGRGY